jgi:hypothetical protein
VQARLDDRVSLKTSRSPALQQRGQVAKRAVHRQWPRPSSRREALRSGAGCWAISSGGRSKSKSASVWRRGAASRGKASWVMVQAVTGLKCA